jgi:hypothetical protein
MRNKQVIEKAATEAENSLLSLYRDIDSGKPHITIDYIKQQLAYAIHRAETIRHYLDLED